MLQNQASTISGKLDREREAKQEAIDYLLALHGALDDGDLRIAGAFDSVPGLNAYIKTHKSEKRMREKALRTAALLRMSKDEAAALGLLGEWETVQAEQPKPLREIGASDG